MLTTSFKVALLVAASVIDARSVLDTSKLHGGVHKRQNTDSSATTLAANAIQTGSSLDGSNEIGAAEVGQALSKTSTNNFINNCAGKTLTNGLQITTGSCNGIPMGDIPAKTAMVSSIITFPQSGSSNIQSDTTFNISVQMSNLVAGSFTNADATYYAAPQQLEGGKVVGHTHVTVQDLGASLNPTKALDATQFAFFKGINDAGNGQGLLQAVVTGGLPAGNYRVCTMASASNHQPVLMPVAQRGTADDCTKFTVSGNGNTANAASNNGSGGEAAAAAAQSAVDNPGAVSSASGGKATSAGSGAKAAQTSATKAAGNGKATSATTEATKAVGGAGKGGKAVQTPATKAGDSASTSETACSIVTGTVTVDAPGETASATSETASVQTKAAVSSIAPFSNSTATATSASSSAATSVSTSSSALGGIAAPAVQDSGDSTRPFLVNGNTFVNEAAAVQRSCDIQFNACANAVNGQTLSGVTVGDCQTQQTACGK